MAVEVVPFFGFVVVPALALLAAIGLSVYEIYRIEEYRLFVVILFLWVMLQHQLLEWAGFWQTGVVSESFLGEMFETTANVIAAGGVYYLLTLLRRERSLTEELDQREQEFRRLINAAPTPMLYHCPKQIRRVNDATVSMLGADDKDDLVGRSLPEFVVPEDRETVEAAIDPDSRGEAQQNTQITMESLDGERRHVVFSAEPVGLGGRNGVQVALNDITERERSRRELQETKERFRTLFRNMQDGVLVIDTEENRFLDANDRACEMLGYSKAELKALDPVEIHPHETGRFETFLESAIEEETLVTDGLSCRRKDGRQFSAEVSAGTIRIDDTSALLVSIRDITERTRRKRQIEFLNRLFRHNVRNRVNVLIGNAEVIKKRGSEEVADIAEVIDSVGNRFVETSEKIQEMTGILKDGVGPGVEQTNVSDLVEDVVAEFREDTPEATFETGIEDDVHINGDDSIRVAVENLVENAVEHAGENPTVSVSVRHDYADTGMVEIVVADDGPGLPENEQAAVTNPEATSPLEHGSGLGLHLVTQTVAVYGGEFDVECPEAGGTRATIRLPLMTDPVGSAVAERTEG